MKKTIGNVHQSQVPNIIFFMEMTIMGARDKKNNN